MTRSERDRRLDEEIRHHIEMATEANILRGMTPAEARRAAVLAFGATEHFKDDARDEFRSRIWAALRQDIRYALGSARRSVGYTAIVIATFALGIGANTAMFTLVNNVLLKPLPYAAPERLVTIGSSKGGISAPDFLDMRGHNGAFESLALWDQSRVTLAGKFDPEELVSVDVSAGFFATVGVRPVLGRDFGRSDEAAPGTTVILSHALWMRRYDGDRTIIGRSIVIDGRGVTVIGIAPPGLDPLLSGDIYRPFDFHAPHATVRAYRTQPVIARLRPGMSIAAAQAAMNIVEQQLGTVYPEDAGVTIHLQRYYDAIVGRARPLLLYLAGAVIVVLLIACGNVVSLMLARASTRQAELSTRVALGASRGRLVQQLVTESTLLAVAGGAIGLAFAVIVLRALRLDATTALPRTADLHVSAASFGFTALLSLVAGTLVGAATAWRATTLAVHPSLSIGAHGSDSPRGIRIREGIVTLQLVASLVLLASASVLLESFWHTIHVSPGFDERNVVTGTVVMPAERYPFANAVEWWATMIPQIAAIPHVKSVSAASQIPFAPRGDADYVPAGLTIEPGVHRPSALINVVADHYFATMRIPILSGRTFGTQDTASAYLEVVISQSVARKLARFGAADGQRISFPGFGAAGITGVVVGVAGDVRADLGRDPPDVIYFPLRAMSSWARDQHLLVRTDGDPLSVVPQIRRMIAQSDPQLPLGHVSTMAAIIGRSVAGERLDATILGGFGAAALFLAALGLYGLLAHAVANRRREFSIRLALGAQRQQLFALVLRNGMRLVALGLGAGLVLTPIAAHLLRGVFGAVPINLQAVAASTLALGAIGLLACVFPAIRATRIGAELIRQD